MELSKDYMVAFQNARKYQDRIQGFEFNVNVLTAGFWPTYPTNELALPEQVISS